MKKCNAAAAFRRSAISIAVGMCIAGVVHAQGADGNILGKAKAGATVTLTGPKGMTSQSQAKPDGSFTFMKLAPGTYKVTSDGITQDVIVAAGVDSRVSVESSAVEKITVTGSRIQRDSFNSASPVLVITRDETLMSGFNSTTAALQSTGVTGGSAQLNNAFGGFVVDGGPGVNTISLRGLGPTRSLVLLNGRRISPAGTRGSVGAADLNVLPTAIVDRIEILKDGASSIYGSDAVAGVVNVITKKNITGVTLEAQYNYPENGGGAETRASATFGTTGDRSFLSGTIELYDREDLTWGDRDWMKCQTAYRRRVTAGVPGEWGSLDFIDPRTGKPKCYTTGVTGEDGVTINTIGTGNVTGVGAPGSTGTTFNRWRPNPAITTGLAGYEGVGGGQTTSLNVRDTFAPGMLNQSLISPAQVASGFLQGGYDLKALGNAEAYFEALFTRRESEQTGHRQLILDYAPGNQLIPADLRGVPNNLSGGSLVTPGPVQIRAFIDGGNYKGEQEVDYSKVLGGLRGNLPWADWKYDGVVTYANSDATYIYEVFLTNRVRQSLDVVANAGGGFTCRDPSNGCVAAPAITNALIGGQLPQDWLNFAYVRDTGKTKYKETTATLNTNGSLFAMQHGDVRGAIGAEYRRAEIDDTPSADMQASNLYNFTSATKTQGSDSVWELYGEAEFPLLRGMEGAQELTLNVSGRYTDYKSYGGDTTYKMGALWSPVKSVSFRATHGTSYRAPALFEQYVGATSGFGSSTLDPCNNYGANPGTTRATNCASEGLPPNFQAIAGVQSNTVGGAAAGLEAETSKNTTLGVIFQPELATGWGDLSLALDYYDIQVDNGVDRVGPGNILRLCYDDPAFRAGGAYCRLVTRAPAGTNRALVVNNSYINVSTDVVKGYDFTVRYVRNIGEGQFRASGLVTKYKEQASRLFSDDPLESVNGTINTPDLTAVMDLEYTWKAWRFRYGLSWTDSMDSYAYLEQNPETSTQLLKVPSYYVHGVSVKYTADKWSVIGGVRNLADKEPPQISSGFYTRRGNSPLYSGYDYVGRTWYVNAQYIF